MLDKDKHHAVGRAVFESADATCELLRVGGSVAIFRGYTRVYGLGFWDLVFGGVGFGV